MAEVREKAGGVMGCLLYLMIGTIGFVISACFLLLLAEWIFPKTVHVLNYSLSSRTFTMLTSAHKYQAAADFFEQKNEVFTTSGSRYSAMFGVFECYRHIGEYEKAETVMRDLYDGKYLTEEESKGMESNPDGQSNLKFTVALELFGLYEDIGDVEGQKRCYSIMKQYDADELFRRVQDSYPDKDRIQGKLISVADLLKVYDYKMEYLDNPAGAIEGIGAYVKEIGADSRYTPAFVLKCTVLWINWTVEQYGVIAAYPIICAAVNYVDAIDRGNNDKSSYGDLSDICFRVHDITNSKKLYALYTTFLKGTTSADDPLFIDNQVRGFKFMEQEEDWDGLEKSVIECCEGLKTLLSKNLSSMSEYQREHFVDLLDAPFDYASDLLYSHPSDALAELCFDNTVFMKGLLLRSNRELANRIGAIGDSLMLERYRTLQEYRKELSYREGLGKVGNAIRKAYLKNSIEKLDKELNVSCSAYREDEESAKVSSRDISRSLSGSSVAMEFIHTSSDNLLALILGKDGTITPVRLGNIEDIRKAALGDHRRLYSDRSLYDCIWASLERYLSGIDDIYYSSNGIFNSISFPALYIGGRNHLADRYTFHLMSNIGEMASLSGEDVGNGNPLMVAMWGDVDYGGGIAGPRDETSPYRDIERGDRLRRLVYSAAEIDAISSIVREAKAGLAVYEGKEATESSFRSRSGRNDGILHISTHGFFDEDNAHRKDYNPMYNSGLLFAGADSTWNRADTAFVASSMLDDGILRADEIQYLDFTGCSLAVLSACRTGLGQSRKAEGVYGLQRAFKLAGVDKILMSLWNVDDRCTSELMAAFYRNLYSGDTCEQALRKAQAEIRAEYPSPEYWGAFVLLN